MSRNPVKKLKVVMPGVEHFEIDEMAETELKKKICKKLGIEEQFTNLLFKRSGKEIIVDYIWSRQQIQLGKDGQARLRRGNCVIIGVGALGNDLVRNLVLMGMGNITLIDFDKVELSNLIRTLFTNDDVGKNKAVALAEIMNRHYPYAKLKAIPKRVERVSPEILKKADVLISGLDNMFVRIWLTDFAIKHNIPLIDGGLKGLQARVQVWMRGRGCLACEIPPENYAEIMDLHNSCESAEETKIAAFPTVSSITAAVQANEAMKIMLGKEPMNGVLIIDLLYGSFNVMPLARNPNCIVCKGK